MIFISHKTKPDHTYALAVANILQSNDIECWLAPESLGGGEGFSMKVPETINSCEMFLLILTKDTAASAYVRSEIMLARYFKKTIIPLKIGEFDIDDSIGSLIRDYQRIPFDFSESAVDSLVKRCREGERIIKIEVSKNPARKVTILKGNYSDNLVYLMNNGRREFENCLFAMGIDCSSNLKDSTTKGILIWVCELLEKEYDISIDRLQNLINEAKMKQLGHKTKSEPMKPKDVVIIDVPLQAKDGSTLTLKMLLIANSWKKRDGALPYKEEVEGPDSREIIMKVFEECKNYSGKIDSLFIGAFGTNGLNFPYGVAITEIFNCYAYAKIKNFAPRNLYFSTRSEDIERWGFKDEDIISYITTIINSIVNNKGEYL